MKRDESLSVNFSGVEFCAVGEVLSAAFRYREKRKGENVEYSQFYLRPDSIVLADGISIDLFDALQIISLNNKEKFKPGDIVKVVGVFQQSPWMTFEDGGWFKLQDCLAHKIKLKE